MSINSLLHRIFGVLSLLVIFSVYIPASIASSTQRDFYDSSDKENWIQIDSMVPKASSVNQKAEPIIKDGFPVFPHHYSQYDRASADQQILAAFNIKPKMTIEQIQAEIKKPSSQHHNKPLTSQLIDSLTANDDATQAVKSYLEKHGIKNIINSDNGLMLAATAPVKVYEKLLNTKFYEYKHDLNPKQTVIRAHHYSLPKDIAIHVVDVSQVSDFPSAPGEPSKKNVAQKISEAKRNLASDRRTNKRK